MQSGSQSRTLNDKLNYNILLQQFINAIPIKEKTPKSFERTFNSNMNLVEYDHFYKVMGNIAETVLNLYRSEDQKLLIQTYLENPNGKPNQDMLIVPDDCAGLKDQTQFQLDCFGRSVKNVLTIADFKGSIKFDSGKLTSIQWFTENFPVIGNLLFGEKVDYYLVNLNGTKSHNKTRRNGNLIFHYKCLQDFIDEFNLPFTAQQFWDVQGDDRFYQAVIAKGYNLPPRNETNN
jgi:hypothetical protein